MGGGKKSKSLLSRHRFHFPVIVLASGTKLLPTSGSLFHIAIARGYKREGGRGRGGGKGRDCVCVCNHCLGTRVINCKGTPLHMHECC